MRQSFIAKDKKPFGETGMVGGTQIAAVWDTSKEWIRRSES